MSTLVICEKPSQARNVAIAIGSQYGDVLPCQGHLLRLEMPDEVNPAWKKWNLDILSPPKGLYAYVPDAGSGKGPRLQKIKTALRGATQVIIATDCDREGQGIGQSILEMLKFRGAVKRVMFTAEDATSLRKAFTQASANSNYEPLYQAFVARIQADQIYNLTLTRVATTHLKVPFTKGVIGVGRVKSPTLGIICRREKEILGFQPVDYFVIEIEVTNGASTVKLQHATDEKHRITDPSLASAVQTAAGKFSGPISVIREQKSKAPPRPYDLPTLEQRANTLWGWTVKKTDEIAQKLYEEHKVTTYPRAESQYLPETMIPEAPKLFSMLTALDGYSNIGFGEARIRKGADGVFSDKKLEGMSHHAIIPNINCPGSFKTALDKLDADESKLFDLIARRYLACLGPDYIFNQTTISILAPMPEAAAPGPRKFSTSGSTPVKAGWRAAESGLTVDEDADETDDNKTLPPFTNGEPVRAGASKVIKKTTEPPKRYTEAGLIKAMQEAWRFVDNPEQRERLKEAKGLGTPATRASILEGLKKQGQIAVSSKNLVPTVAGMLIYDVFMDVAPVVMDPAATARMEARLDDILSGAATAEQVISEITAQAKWVTNRITQSSMRVDLEKGKKVKASPKSTGPASRSTAPTSRDKPKAPQKAPATGSPPPSNGPEIIANAGDKEPGRIYLRVPHDQNFIAHRLGVKFDAKSGQSWVPSGSDCKPFREKGWL